MIEPQNLNISVLPCLFLEQRKTLPKCAGIYFVINANEEILYIGQSLNFKSRWQCHRKYELLIQLEKPENLKIAWLELTGELLEKIVEIESALIEWFDPPLNRREEKPKSGKRAICTLREYINNRGLTQFQVAKDTNLSPTIIGHLANNQFKRIDCNTAEVLCKYLNCEFGDLFKIISDNNNNDQPSEC